jgi:hypothetical protein
VLTKIVLKVGFLERDFECDHYAEKSYWTKIYYVSLEFVYSSCVDVCHIGSDVDQSSGRDILDDSASGSGRVGV